MSDVPSNTPPVLPLPADGVGSEKFWRDEITQAQKRRRKEQNLWKANIARYRSQKPKLPGLVPSDTITVNLDFVNTEQKKAQLFYQRPEVQLAPKEGQPAEIAALFGRVLNYYLGPDEIHAESMVDDALFDVICPAGIGVTKIGFEEITEE